MLVLKIIGNFIWKNIGFFLILGIIVFIGIVSYSCTENKKANESLTELVNRKNDTLAVTRFDLKVITEDRDSCRKEQERILLAGKQAREAYAKKVIAFRETVSKLTPAEKQAKLLTIAKEVVKNQKAEEDALGGQITPDNDTTSVVPLGTINLGGKEFPYYTEEQQDLLIWAVGEGQILQGDKKATADSKAVYDELTQVIAKHIVTDLEEELNHKHFLGINQKKDLKALRKDLIAFFKKYNIKI